MYIDPNTGGMLFQVLAVILGIFTGAVMLFSSKIRSGVARVRRNMRPDDLDNQEEPTENGAAYTGQIDHAETPPQNPEK